MSPRTKENSERINVFFSPSIVEQLRKAAEERGASVSGLVRMIVLNWLRAEEEKHAQD